LNFIFAPSHLTSTLLCLPSTARPDFDDANRKMLVAMCKEVQAAKKDDPKQFDSMDKELQDLPVDMDCESIMEPAHQMMKAMRGVPALCDPDYAKSIEGKQYNSKPPVSPVPTTRELWASNFNCANVCTAWTLGSCAWTCGSAIAKCFYGNYYGCAQGVLNCAAKARTCCTCGARARLYYCGYCGY